MSLIENYNRSVKPRLEKAIQEVLQTHDITTFDNKSLNSNINKFLQNNVKSLSKGFSKSNFTLFKEYKDSPEICDIDSLCKEISQIGYLLPSEILLFRGSLFSEGIQGTPLSTSWSPQVAFAEMYKHLYYLENISEVHFIIYKTVNSITPVYIYDNGHESEYESDLENSYSTEYEVLFTRGSSIRLREKNLINSNYCIHRADSDMTVPLFVILAEIS